MGTQIKYGQLYNIWRIAQGLGIIAIGTTGVVALFSTQNPAGLTTSKEFSDGSREQSGSLLIESGSTTLHADATTRRLGIGKRDPKATVDALGILSGKLLTVSSLRNCTLKTSGTGDVLCGTDNTGGSSVTAGQGLGLNGAVLTLNGTITGSLVRFTTVSGSLIKANSTLASSGTLVWEGAASGSSLYISTSINGSGLVDCDLSTQTLAWDSTTGRFSCGTDSDTTYTAGQGLTLTSTSFKTNSVLTGSLVSFGTVSGSLVHARTTLASSGTLAFEGAATGSSLYLGTKLEGAGLVDCDLATQTLAWDATTGRFGCGTDASGAWSNTGSLQAYFDPLYVDVAGDTMEGPLAIDIASASTLLTVSGDGYQILDLSENNDRPYLVLSNSGGNVFEFASQGNNPYFVMSNANGNILEISNNNGRPYLVLSNTAGNFFEVAENNNSPYLNLGSAAGYLLQIATGGSEYNSYGGDNDFRFIGDNDASLLVTDASADRVGIGTDGPDTKLEVIGTASGRTLHAQDLLRSSGSLITEAGAIFDGGVLYVDAPGNQVGVGTTTPKTAFDVIGTLSGRLLTQNGAGSNYFRGRLGVGTASPSSTAIIHAYSSGAGVVNKFLMEDTLSAVYVIARNTAAPLGFRMGVQGNGATQFGSLDNSALNFITNSVGMATILGNGNMGIGFGVTAPGSKLSVSGSVIIGQSIGTSVAKTQLEVRGTVSGSTLFGSTALQMQPRASAPAAPVSGMMYMDSTPAPDELCVYDGTGWQALITGTDANCV